MRSARWVVVAAALLLTACGAPATSPAPAVSTLAPGASATSGGSATATPGGSSTAAVPSSPTPSSTPTASAVTYGTDFALSGDSLSFQPLTWYEGAKARARCKEKKIEPELEWCNDYYYEDAGARTSAVLTADVGVALLGDGVTPSPSTRAKLVAALRDEEISYARISRAGDDVVRVEQVFTP